MNFFPLTGIGTVPVVWLVKSWKKLTSSPGDSLRGKSSKFKHCPIVSRKTSVETFWKSRKNARFLIGGLPDSNDFADVQRYAAHLRNENSSNSFVKGGTIHINCRSDWNAEADYFRIDLDFVLQSGNCDRQSRGTVRSRNNWSVRSKADRGLRASHIFNKIRNYEHCRSRFHPKVISLGREMLSTFSLEEILGHWFLLMNCRVRFFGCLASRSSFGTHSIIDVERNSKRERESLIDFFYSSLRGNYRSSELLVGNTRYPCLNDFGRISNSS